MTHDELLCSCCGKYLVAEESFCPGCGWCRSPKSKKAWDELVECCARTEEDLFRSNLPDGTDDEWRGAILAKDAALKLKDAQLCRAREAAVPWHQQSDELINALCVGGPCCHEAEARMRRIANDNLRKELIEKDARNTVLQEAFDTMQILKEGVSEANEELRGQLCRVREWCDKHGFDNPTNMSVVQPIIRSLIDISPCAHKKDLKNLRTTLTQHGIIVTMFPGGGIQIEPGNPPSPYIAKEGK